MSEFTLGLLDIVGVIGTSVESSTHPVTQQAIANSAIDLSNFYASSDFQMVIDARKLKAIDITSTDLAQEIVKTVKEVTGHTMTVASLQKQLFGMGKEKQDGNKGIVFNAARQDLPAIAQHILHYVAENPDSAVAQLVKGFEKKHNRIEQNKEERFQQRYADIVIPVPSKPIIINEFDSVESVHQKMDTFFEDMIRDYPDKVKNFVREMYYDDKHVISVEGYTELTGSGATALTFTVDRQVAFKVLIDSETSKCPIITKWYKIHEAVHILQQAQLHNYSLTEQPKIVRQIEKKIEKMLESLKNPGSTTQNIMTGDTKKEEEMFLEQSVSLPEILLIHSIPSTFFLKDVENTQNYGLQQLLLERIGELKNLSVEDYLDIDHRTDVLEKPDSVANERYLKRFKNRPDVAGFASCIRAIQNDESTRLSR